MQLSLADLTALAAKHRFPDPELAAAIAWAESTGNSCAQGDPNIGKHPCSGPNGTSQSFGLWQVDTAFNKRYDATRLLDPDYNANAAFEIYNALAGNPPSRLEWRPWSTAWDDPNHRVGYLGTRALFRPFYRPSGGFSRITPPASPPSGAPVVLAAVALATFAGYAASERRRFV